MGRKSNLLLIGVLVLVFGALGYFVSDWYFSRSNSVEAVQPAPQSLAPVAAVPSISSELVGSKLPTFSLPDLEGKAHTGAEWQGKILLLNFWATWCPPCRKEMPGFINLQDEYRDEGFQVVGIAIDEIDAVRDFSDTLGVNYVILIGETDAIALSSKLGNHFGALPYSVLVDREGLIRMVKPGELSEAALEAELAKLL